MATIEDLALDRLDRDLQVVGGVMLVGFGATIPLTAYTSRAKGAGWGMTAGLSAVALSFIVGGVLARRAGDRYVDALRGLAPPVGTATGGPLPPRTSPLFAEARRRRRRRVILRPLALAAF